jgi:hypothetical protein
LGPGSRLAIDGKNIIDACCGEGNEVGTLAKRRLDQRRNGEKADPFSKKSLDRHFVRGIEHGARASAGGKNLAR